MTSNSASDESEKSFDPTPQKLRKAREKGEVPRSADLSVAASYFGLLIVFSSFGGPSLIELANQLSLLLSQSDNLATTLFSDAPAPLVAGVLGKTVKTTALWFLMPAVCVLLVIVSQRAFVVTPSKLQFKASRVSILSNAKNKFGRNGLFEFAKSFAKLVLFSIALGLYFSFRGTEMIALARLHPAGVAQIVVNFGLEFLLLTTLLAGAIGILDTFWQHGEHIRKNRMSRKEIMDEVKESDGDPHLKQERRQRAHAIANSQMITELPTADVVLVNPTHYSVALKWSRTTGSAPECVAKGVDEMAATIREIAQIHAVPIFSDPPTARALFAIVEPGDEVPPDLYAPVAVAIRFAESMRVKARERIT